MKELDNTAKLLTKEEYRLNIKQVNYHHLHQKVNH
jgi:hypothetical protein